MDKNIQTKEQALEAIEELKKFIEAEESKGAWKPKHGEDYYRLAVDIGVGGVCIANCTNRITTEANNDILFGNCYPTREIAEAEAKHLAAYRRLRNRRRELIGDWKPDWSDDGEGKYVVGMSCNRVDSHIYGTMYEVWSFPTPELRDQFMREMESDLKIYYGIEK